MRPLLALATALLLLPLAAAHGDLEINETETLAISDFEGFEDAFPWGGFEIWDVYVGEGYDEAFGADGVYVKANFAGTGEMRPPGQDVWSVTFRFSVGEETFERSFQHDGSAITHDFDGFLSMVADGNVLQVKAWVAVPDAAGKSLKDLVLVSAVDGDPRDTAPGGIHVPRAGAAVPVEAPATPIFPPLGQGRVVEEVPLTGPTRFFTATAAPSGDGRFTLTVTNSLAEQGQHVAIHPRAAEGWRADAGNATTVNLKGGASGELSVLLEPTAAPGAVLPPLRVDLVSDIGGRLTFFAALVDGAVVLVPEGEPAEPAAIPDLVNEAPGAGALAVAALAGVAWAARRR